MSELKKIRERQNLTQEELAEKSGISVRTIQRIEAGTNPKGYTLKTLASSLDVSEKDLLIAEIVKETAKECNLPYHEFKTMRGAVIAHFKHLRDLGQNPAIA